MTLVRVADEMNGGMWVRYSVVGPRGAVNLTFGKPDERFPFLSRRKDGWWGVDFGVHSPRPQYEGHEPQPGGCELLREVECFYDGSGLRADRYLGLIASGDVEGVYAVLEAEYEELFGTVPS